MSDPQIDIDAYEGETYEELCVEISDGYMGETGDLVREHARSVLELRQLRQALAAVEAKADEWRTWPTNPGTQRSSEQRLSNTTPPSKATSPVGVGT